MRLSLFAVAAVLAAACATPAVAQRPNHQLDATFTQADKNKDGFLDADELAMAFRGANAKPILDKPGAKETHPDHAFLDAWDANQDGKISKAEFEKYEARYLAAAKASANRNRTYTRANRPSYRSAYRHGPSNRGYGVSRGYGTNPYTAVLRAQQRAYQLQRSAYSNFVRYGVYTPTVRSGYRGSMSHHHASRYGRRR